MEKNGPEMLAETLDELDRHNLRLYTIYLEVDLDDRQPYHGEMDRIFRLLRQHNTMPWFYVTSDRYPPSSEQYDSVAVPILRELADMAHNHGLKIMVYPHHNFWVESVEDGIRVSRKVKRRNFGFTFNLPHYLAEQGVEAETRLKPLAEKAMPYLFAISLNGADRPTREIMKKDYLWDHFINPLGEGEFNTFNYLETFVDMGFEGPVGLQCYGIEQDKKVYLEKSMQVWKEYQDMLDN